MPRTRSRFPGPRPRAALVLVAPALLALGLLLQYAPALRMPFLADDYSFLEKTRWTPFVQLWGRENLFSHWYRPVSRETYYWLMQRLVGLDLVPWHLVSFALWLGVMAAFVALGARVAGRRAAWLAAACVAALASWGGTLLWVAGVQELWMLLFALLFLLAFAARKTVTALLALALALLSKETAGLLPGMALAWSLAVDRDRLSAALRRMVPVALVWLAWALVHPWVLPRLLGRGGIEAESGSRPALALVLLRTALAPFNLEQWPAPMQGWTAALARGLPGAVAVVALAWWALRQGPSGPGEDAAPPPPSRGVTVFLAAWAVLGAVPLLVPSIGWHAYYGILGALGLWLLLARPLARRPALALAVVAALALLRPLRAETRSWDWSSQAYFERAGAYLESLRGDLLRRHPTMPPHARLWFRHVPQNIGLVVGDGPAFRIWYGERTLLAGFWSEYRPRAAGERAGPDYFFTFDGRGWREVARGAEDVALAARAPDWEADHRELARLLGSRGDWPGAAQELEKLTRAFPANPEYARNLAYCRERAKRGE